MNILPFLAIFVTTCWASNVVDIDFQNNLDDLKISIWFDLSTDMAIKRFNIGSQQLSTETEPSVMSLRKFYEAKEEAISLIMKNTQIPLDTPEIQTFHEHLVKELERFDDSFSTENLESVILFLNKASRHALELEPILAKLAHFLRNDQLNIILKEFYSIDESESFESANLNTSLDQSMLYSILVKEGTSKLTLKADYFGILLQQAIQLNFEEHPEWLKPTLIAVKNIIFKFKNDSNILKHVSNFILCESVIKALPEDELLNSFTLIIGAISGKVEIFDRLASLSENCGGKVLTYNVKVEEITKTYKLLAHIINLKKPLEVDLKSIELRFKLAFRALETLKIESRKSELVRETLILEFETVHECFSEISSFSQLEDHPMCLNSWRFTLMVGSLYFDLVSGYKRIVASSNAITGLGYILYRYRKESLPTYVTDHIKEVLPNIDVMVNETLTSIIEAKMEFTRFQLNILIRVFKIHPIPSAGDALVDRVLVQYASVIPPMFDKFAALRDFEVTDMRGVYINVFLSCLLDYLSAPIVSRLPILLKYLRYLNESKLLSKTEIIFMEKYLNSLKI